jgi:hypothetical protein
MSAASVVLDVVQRNAPVVLWAVDAGTGRTVRDRLAIDISPYGVGAAVSAVPNHFGLWIAAGLPGLRGYENGSADDLASRRAARRRFRVTVRDLAGRYLPVAFDAGLPTDDLFAGLPPGALPLPSAGSPPLPAVAQVPLFPAPAAQAAGTEAELRAELRESGSGRPAAWALLQARIDGVLRGVGLSDGRGCVLVRFPHPDRPRPVFVSPPQPPATSWLVQITACYRPPPAGAAAGAVADLAELLAALAAPRTLLGALSPPAPLGTVELQEGVALVLRSGAAPFLTIDVP